MVGDFVFSRLGDLFRFTVMFDCGENAMLIELGRKGPTIMETLIEAGVPILTTEDVKYAEALARQRGDA
jgi:hypothetical protein